MAPSSFESNMDAPKKEVGGLEPVAIIGFSLRFPQEATSAASFWNLLLQQRCTMTEWPKERLNVDAFYHLDKSRNDTIPLRGGHFLKEDVGLFDAPFFSMTSAEAASMDPQHRIELETAFHALENAGLPLEKVSGSNTGIYTGSFSDDFKTQTTQDLENLPKYAATGESHSLLANRLSWFFNFTGPSMHIDTACSSSLVALDVACQGLRNKESNMALVAGCNLIYGLSNTLKMTNMNFLSPDSRCFSFDHRANGYARGEGVGIVVLKTLTDAVADGDIIRGIIRSTGCNQDGHTPGITQPSSSAQEALIQQTYRKAGLELDATRFFEAHGTGTAIGDPTEANAIGSVFKLARSREDPLYVGAVKANLGHLEGASGIAGLIKALLVLEKGVIPGNANFEKINPQIDADALALRFPLEATPWPVTGLRRASVNSFGFGGSNSHVVLDDVYHYLKSRGITGKHCTVENPLIGTEDGVMQEHGNQIDIQHKGRVNGHSKANHHSGDTRARLLMWSTADEKGAYRMEDSYNKHFAHNINSNLSAHGDEGYLRNLAYTLASHRTSLPWKSFAVVQSVEDLRQGVSLSKPVQASNRRGIAFVFSGQGAQHAKMAQDLLVYDVFQRYLLAAESQLRDLGSKWFLMTELLKESDESRINEPELSQPLCTAVQLALVELCKAWGLTPSAVVGHSSGEIAAAYALGALDFRSALKVAYFRGKLANKLASSDSAQCTMMSIGMSETEAATFLQIVAARGISGTVACINSPNNVTISGSRSSVSAMKATLDEAGIFARELLVTVGYHSPQMNTIAEEYADALGDLKMGENPVKPVVMVSSVTSKRTDAAELNQVSYWVQNMVRPVKFSQALTSLLAPSSTSAKKIGGKRKATLLLYDLLEIGPHSALRAPIKSILGKVPRGSEVTYRSLLIRDISAVVTTLETMGYLSCRGYEVLLDRINFAGKELQLANRLSDLPEYPFNHSKVHWTESRISRNQRLREFGRLDLLGTPSEDWNHLEARWRNIIRASRIPWVEDHVINDATIYPAAGMLVMAIEAANQLADKTQPIDAFLIEEATMTSAIPISGSDEGCETQLYMRRLGDSTTRSEFRLCSFINGNWVENCRGIIRVEYGSPSSKVDHNSEALLRQKLFESLLKERQKACSRQLDPAQHYKHCANLGMRYGPSFRSLSGTQINDHEREAVAEVSTFPWQSKGYQPHVVHPVTLDVMFQLMFLALTKAHQVIPTTVPTGVRGLWVSNRGVSFPETLSLNLYCKSASRGWRGTESHLFALDKQTNELKVVIEELTTTNISKESVVANAQSEKKQMCYNIELKPDIGLLTNTQLSDYCQRTIRPPESQNGLPDSTFAILLFVSRALHDQNKLTVGEVKPHLRKYEEWMRAQLADAGQNFPGWSNHDWLSSQNDGAVDEIVQRLEACGNHGRLLAAVGKNLSDLTSGKLSLLDLFSQNELEESYYEGFFEADGHEALAEYLSLLEHRDSQLKVLDIQCGPVNMTSRVLSLMSGVPVEVLMSKVDHYDATGDSGFTFQSASEWLLNYDPFLDNVRHDYGFRMESYDLIVCGSPLAFSNGRDRILKNIRRLLRPQGKLVMLETFRPTALKASFIFGLLPNWWDRNANMPCQPDSILSRDQWQQELSKNGIQLETCFQDHQEALRHEMGFMISSAAAREIPESLGVYPLLIIVDKVSALQVKVAGHLQKRLTDSKVDCQIAHIQNLPSDVGQYSEYTTLCLLELEKPCLLGLDALKYSWLQALILTSKKLLWVKCECDTEVSPAFAMITGLVRVVHREIPHLELSTLALETRSTAADYSEPILKVLQKHSGEESKTREVEYIEKRGLLHTSRLAQAGSIDEEISTKTKPQLQIQPFGLSPPLKMVIANQGQLDTIRFVEDQFPHKPLGPQEVEIEVKAVGMNATDRLNALGRTDKSSIGSECSGIVNRAGVESGFQKGDRVCGAIYDSCRSLARCHRTLLARIPDQLSFGEAASIPVVGTLAYYAIFEAARLHKGESILIHGAAGGLGQFAIQLAQYIGAEIYATVSSEHKRDLLIRQYGISEDHIFNSRDASFAHGITRMTKNRGVKVILSALEGDLLEASWSCIASFGRFIQVEKQANLPQLPTHLFKKNCSFISVNVDDMISEAPQTWNGSLVVISNLMTNSKAFKVPTPLTVYPISRVDEAIRQMQDGKHAGKMVIQMNSEAEVQTILEARPECQLLEDASYVIVGGLGGIGRSAAKWMADQGAKHLVLLSRSGAVHEAALKLVESLTERGVQVSVPKCDVTDQEALQKVLQQCSEDGMPPIKGCLQAAMHLQDALFETMSFDQWNACIRPKVQGTWNLHSTLPRNLDFFIMLSSISGVIGNPGQANYAAGNTFQDALAHYRVSLGQKAISIDLGAVSDVGAVAQEQKLKDNLLSNDYMIPVTENEILAFLDRYCSPRFVPNQDNCQVVVGLAPPSTIRARGAEVPDFMHTPLYRTLHRIDQPGDTSTPTKEVTVDYEAEFAAVGSLAEAGAIVTTRLTERLAQALSMPATDIDTNKPLPAYGVDSLVAVELRNWIAKHVKAELAVFDLMTAKSIVAVGETVAGKSKYARSEWKAAED